MIQTLPRIEFYKCGLYIWNNFILLLIKRGIYIAFTTFNKLTFNRCETIASQDLFAE